MHPIVESKRAEIAALCRELGVRRLDVFGSAVSDDFDVERSDAECRRAQRLRLRM
ncbi:hypothetical protein FHX44_117519 [Pseudonocardia hierapolitana]|uniref:Uncharacterized protein n=1 Tax=Pseudonocardia hierapolitana TaxID=1128676 RepID=A0A561T383_9PSEU|nr:hypothetical protein [Pseudonocardia hierapolitana]TWF81574.1 hypothetical protein FHX44_117519 [Pseudonocardia hierapolitana]